MIGLEQKQFCKSSLIAAYVDGELEETAAKLLEQHLESCDDCRVELRAHQIFICELDAALTDRVDVQVPSDFSRIVATRAVSDMSGVRSRSEHKKALIFSLILALISFALIGATTRETGFVIARKFASNLWGIVSFLSTTLYDIMASVVVISRAIADKVVSESRVFGLLLLLLAVAVFLLSHLISKYHRIGATE